MMRFVWIVVVVCVKCSAMSRDELEDFSDFLKKTSQLDLTVKKGADPDDVFDEDDEVSDHAWEESGKFEGDLILNDRQRRLIIENVEGLSRNGLTDSTKRWPNNEVIYFIQREHFNEDQVQAIQDGIEDLGRASCVKFRPYRRGDRDAVVIQGSRRGCFSQVGYQGGYQVLNLSGRHPAGRGCFRHGTVVHELLHTLGFYHMQSSPDRDDYINVIWENIIQPARHNFRKYNSFSVSDFGVGYDYDSVLHYSRRAFSSNGKDTLVPKLNGARIGQRVGLSDKDTQKLNKMYCDADTLTYDADETQKPKNKKKKPKNKPFQGHGIGYHQGKTVIIKVPTSETYKLSPNPSIVEFDFRRAPQTLQTPQIEDYRVGKEIIYNYNPSNEDVFNKIHKPAEKLAHNEENNKNTSIENENESSQTDDSASKEQVDTESEELDEDLEEAFDRLVAIAKQRIYPEKDYSFKINDDYSQFYSPSDRKQIHPSDQTESVLYYADNEGNIKSKAINKPREKNYEKYSYELKPASYKDAIDPSYRTSLLLRKPYSADKKIDNPSYATRDYLNDRHDYSQYYSGKGVVNPESAEIKVHNEPYKVLNDNVPTSIDEWYKKDNLKQGKENYEPTYYIDSVENERSSEEDEEPHQLHQAKTTKSPNLNSKYHERSSEEEEESHQLYQEKTTKSPNLNSKYHERSSEEEEESHQLYQEKATKSPNLNSKYHERSSEEDEELHQLYKEKPTKLLHLNSKYHERNSEEDEEPYQLYQEKTTKSPNLNSKYHERSSEEDDEFHQRYQEKKTKSPNLNSKYQLFGNPVSLDENWYKPNYSTADYNPQSYTENVSESDEDPNR